MPQLLTDDQRAQALDTLPGWQDDPQAGAITREFRFADFSQAFAFMTRVALAAERLDHHPDWSNTYNRVRISLSTHDAGGVTGRDIDLAATIQALIA